MFKIRIKKYFFIAGLIIFSFGMTKGILKEQKILSFYLFTRQNIFLSVVYFFLTSFFQNKQNQKTLFFGFCCLINNLLMMILYLKIESNIEYQQLNGFYFLVSIMEHCFFPLLFIFYYFFIDNTTLKLKQFYVGLIYPFIYFLITMVVGKMMNKYPYSFLNLINTDKLKFILIILSITIFLVVISLISIYIKNKITNKRNTKQFKTI